MKANCCNETRPSPMDGRMLQLVENEVILRQDLYRALGLFHHVGINPLQDQWTSGIGQ